MLAAADEVHELLSQAGLECGVDTTTIQSPGASLGLLLGLLLQLPRARA